MNIIKEFSEFKGPKDSVQWKVEISSHATTDLTIEDIKRVFNYYSHPENIDFKTEFNKKRGEYDKYPVAKWQLSKSDELENLFFNSIKFEIKDDGVVYANIKFQISFTEEFDRGDVIEWVEGFSRYGQLVPMVRMYNIVNKVDDDEEMYEKEKKFTADLVRNQKWKIEKI